MATLVLAAAGSALGGALGGSAAGLTSLALGKAAGATLGSLVDQRLLGLGSEPVDSGKVDRFRIMGGSEGAVLPRVFGRIRVAGQIIWSSRFWESTHSSNIGGKGGGQQVREFSYSISLAIALCEGTVTRVGRIWADGQAMDQSGLTLRLHDGAEDQLPDPLISAIEGEDAAPSYRGTAYVVFENLDLTPFGNRIPQFNFEIFRRPAPRMAALPPPPALGVRGVALVPGTGEYALATERVVFDRGKGDSEVINVHNDQGLPDLIASTSQMTAELPGLRSVSLVVSWFGDDLRCGVCTLRPAVEQRIEDPRDMPWRVSGTDRSAAKAVSRVDDRPLFGGTPTDASVIQAIRHIRDIGQSVMFYPFILMDISDRNDLPDPWRDATSQPAVPWRGRITLSIAAGRAGSPDKTSAAIQEVEAFFGRARISDFVRTETGIRYDGPDEWSYRRFILHYALLCAEAGGVDAFCIGSEMRGLTQIRDGQRGYPAVRALRELATDVRSILGSDTKIGYAADWSEYFGHQPNDGSGDVSFHLDPLWADSAIDFVGIDNYMPLSDWRDEPDHLDATHGSIYDLDYLKGNVAAGEGYDWYYADAADREAQRRRPIVDGAFGEHWIFRYKDIASWWSEPHFDRVGGSRSVQRTDWTPRSKPIWFTELGCPAVDKGTNQPNVFHDPKSSESFFPYFSSGVRDDFIQYRYLQAMISYWSDGANNPMSDLYAGQMVDMERAHVWAWDARPWPDFPSRLDTWSDGRNYDRGHWLNGRVSSLALAEVVADIAWDGGLTTIDVADLHGGVTGYAVEAIETGRQALQPLMLVYGFDSFAAGDELAFASRDSRSVAWRAAENCVRTGEGPIFARARSSLAETASRVALGFVRDDADYQAGAVEARYDRRGQGSTAQSAMSIVLSEREARTVAERFLGEGLVARDSVEFALPASDLRITPGDVVEVRSGAGSELFRIDRIDDLGHRLVGAVRVEEGIYRSPILREDIRAQKAIIAPAPVHVTFLDLPLLTGDEIPHAPYVAAAGRSAGTMTVYAANNDFGYTFNRVVERRAVLGETLGAFPSAAPGIWMPATLDVRLRGGALQSRDVLDILGGGNAAALSFGGGEWEVFQFQSAELIGPMTYRLGMFLRGQAGTDAIMPNEWPPGSDFILLDSAVGQVAMPISARGLERHYRVGPSAKGYDDITYSHQIFTAKAIGLRPYRPVHLKASLRGDGGLKFEWIRRTRIDGDSWHGLEVPLGEESEQYLVRVRDSDGYDLAIYEVNESHIILYDDNIINRIVTGFIYLEVSQVSGQFGHGPFERIVLGE